MDLDKGLIFNIQRHCTEDGPGIRTTVFLKSCVMKCPWCQNPEGIKPHPEIVWYEELCIRDGKCTRTCPNEALKIGQNGIEIIRERCNYCGECVEACPAGALEIYGKYYTLNELIPILLRDSVFYEKSGGGVTLSGGEPAIQSTFSTKLLKELKKKGIHTVIETSLGVNWKLLEPVVGNTDLVILDIKLMNEEKHLGYLGVPLKLVLTNAKKIAELGKPIWVRTPIIPRYTDETENIAKIADFIRENLPTTERYELVAFNKACIKKYKRLGINWEFENDDLISEEKMNLLTEAARKRGLNQVLWTGIAKKKKVEEQSTPNIIQHLSHAKNT
ncbi:MAG: glycyl-radical enzyme activating protein [Candidatus Jordarchaeaceae archaeon]